MAETEKTYVCEVTGKEYPLSQLRPLISVRKQIIDIIRKTYPNINTEGYISKTELSKFKEEYILELMDIEEGEIGRLEHEVIDSLKNAETLSKNINPEVEEKYTLGQRIADKVAEFGGSWDFIIIFWIVLIIWIIINSALLMLKPFDPYPFILMNLILSCMAAIQAPIIMMSQNRQSVKDRAQTEYDYQVNLKAELEIRQLHEKMDHLLLVQNKNQIEVQKVQLELLQQILHELECLKSKED